MSWQNERYRRMTNRWMDGWTGSAFIRMEKATERNSPTLSLSLFYDSLTMKEEKHLSMK